MARIVVIKNEIPRVKKGYLLGHKVVSLVVFEELVHLDDVGVVLHAKRGQIS